MSDIIIKFGTNGSETKVVEAINKIKAATEGLTGSTKKGSGATDSNTKSKRKNSKQSLKLVNHNRLLDNSFATMRSNILLFNFAMSLGINQMIKFGQQAAKLQQMEKAFNSMSGGSNKASVAIKKLKDATDGTLSSFDLFQQANNAMILGVTRNSDEMADMFDMAQRLGDSLGKDVKLSIESLVTGIGRQSRLMLDNIGIIVKADKAYSDYAREIGKTADALTDAEKKQAFMNAALEAGREKLKLLPDETLNASKKFQQFSAAMSDLGARIGDAALPTIILLADNMVRLANAFNPERVEAYAKVIKVVLAGAMIYYTRQVYRAITAQTKLGWGALITGAGLLAEALFRISGAIESPVEEIPKLTDGVSSFLEEIKTQNIDDLNKSLQEQKDKLQDYQPIITGTQKFINQLTKEIEIEENAIERNGTRIKELKRLREDLNDILGGGTRVLRDHIKEEDGQKEAIQNSITTIQNYIALLNFGFTSVNNLTESQAIAQDMYKKTAQSQLEVNQQNIDMINNLIAQEEATTNNAETLKQYNAVLAFLTNQRIGLNKKEAKSEFDLAQARMNVYSSTLSAMGEVVGMSEKNAKTAAGIQALAATVDAFSGAQKAWKNTLDAGLVTPFPEIAYAAALATGLVNARAVAMSANKIGSSGGSGGGGVYGSFEQGGYVGGNRHAQGGTIIEAERGEFVMSRNAVESIGLETLNQMNQSGGGGSINVSVTGNVLTQDFVEGELAESIKEAVRRGSDFGIG
mgnify:CR=1 FL=1